MDKKTLFSFVILIARFKIPKEENTKCMQSFFRFARELTTIRVAIHSPEQQQMFDDEVTYHSKEVVSRTITLSLHSKI